MIDEILKALEDGCWRTVNELVNKLSFSPRKLQIILEFLVAYDFIEVNRRPGYDLAMMIVEAKIAPSVEKFLHEIEKVET